MNKEYQHSEMIDAYLRNELSADERADFEQLVQKDPLLYNEFLLQKEIVTNLQSYRKAQLKNRLNQIDVSNNSSWSGAASAGMWVGGLALIGLLSWFGYSSLKGTTSNTAVVNVPATISATSPTTQTPEISPNANANNEGAEAMTETNVSVSKSLEKSSLPVKTTSRKTYTTRKNSQSADQLIVAAADTEVSAPSQEDGIKKIDSEPVIEKPAMYGNTSSSNRLNVVDNTNETLKLHYYYRNGRIALLGFDKPYTFLDMPAENTTYLYYEGNFYKLNISQIQPAPIQSVLITEKPLIDSLNKMLVNRK
ncbi:anti-sigma factor family protein [Xanthocytophaga flava]|uniref:anti-sigma factor family protein n=1 Tax=Xanthocytophaga flava TaxID=3048013 RepID=UPI0028D44CA2|nr:hypothetical protein [Xanthocytophaga flavus]MDJ1470373.1 hypothetical protein [Xanthocytophaga flavus]